MIARTISDLPDAGHPNAAVGEVGQDSAAVGEADGAVSMAWVRREAEARLLEWSTQFDPHQVARLGRRIEEVVAPEMADRREGERLAELEKRAWRRRELRLTPDGHGAVHIRGRLDVESAAIVQRALDPLAKPRPTDADAPDLRDPGARTADALVEVCRRALHAGDLPVQRGELPQLVVTIDADRLTKQTGAGRLDNGEALSPAVVRRLGCDAVITRAVLDRDGVPLALGRSERLFTAGQRRALILRDGGCAFPGCDHPPQWAQAHHVVHWIDGGATDVDNGVLLCGYHHRVIHKGHWLVRIAGDRRPEFVPPSYVDPQRRPIRNQFRIPQRE